MEPTREMTITIEREYCHLVTNKTRNTLYDKGGANNSFCLGAGNKTSIISMYFLWW